METKCNIIQLNLLHFACFSPARKFLPSVHSCYAHRGFSAKIRYLEDSMATAIPLVIVAIVVLIAIFLLTRKFWCWYFKITQRVELLEQILAELRNQNERNS